MKRSGKFYSKNEKTVMQNLGLTPTKGSGSGWVEKEDGYNETVLAQLKSTDAESYRIKLEDLKKLEYHATMEHKAPVFVVEFLQTDERYIICRENDIQDVLRGLTAPTTGKRPKDDYLIIDDKEAVTEGVRPKIKGSKKARENFMKEREKQWKKKKKKLT